MGDRLLVVIDRRRFDAFVFDLDGVLTRTASVHARAWKRLFDEYLAGRAARTGEAFVPFDLDADYRRYVDGKPRHAGVRSFLTARGIQLPRGMPADDAEHESVHGLGKRKDRYFMDLVAREGVEVFDPAVALVREVRARGVRTAVASSSRNCAAILRAARLSSLFEVKVDGIDLERFRLAGKPAPDMFLEAARRLGVPPDRAVVFEDATAGVEAARAGRFGLVVGVGEGEHAGELTTAGADVVVGDLGQIRLRDERPPAAAAA
jgi:beta-phosphoglucomutase family hydrolase